MTKYTDSDEPYKINYPKLVACGLTKYTSINTDCWCVCGGKCRPMESYTESLCCCETNEVPDEYFEGETYQTSLIFSVTSEKL